MRKFLFMFLIISAVAACGTDEDVLGPEGDSPLSECFLPDTVRAGDELILQWIGFKEDAALSLKNGDGQECELEIEVITSSGLIAVVPREVPAGEYDLMLFQGGSRKLGTVTVTPARKESDSGPESELDPEPDPEPTPEPDPEPTPEPEPDPDSDPELDPEPDPGTDPDVPSGKKMLSRVECYAPYLGTSRIMLSWDISFEDPLTMTVSESLVEGVDITVQRYDSYVSDASGCFQLAYDGWGSSDNESIEYVRNAEGDITSAEVVRYGKSVPTTFSWVYNNLGCLSEILVSGKQKCSLGYEAGNLTSFQYAVFEYGDPALVNNPDAADVVWGYMSLTNYAVADPFIFFPYLLGWYHPASSQLPDKMLLPDPSGTGTISCQLSYTFDDDGYATCMSWKQDAYPYDLKFIYSSENP